MIDDIKEVFAEVFDVDEDEITLETTKESLDEWDSLKQLELVTKLEEKTGKKLSMDQIITIDSVQKVLELLS